MINYKLKQLVSYSLLLFAICILLYSCHDKKESLDIDYKYGYFPLDSGRYITYDVDSIFSYNANFTRDTVRYQLKELVSDTFYDLHNDLNYELSLYRRANNSSAWVFDRKWYAIKGQYNVQRIEDDIRLVKMVFPPIQDQTWNGNVYVPTTDPYRSFQNWNYYYESVDAPYEINGFSFDSSLTVNAVNDSSFVDKRLRKEVYAKGVGMIYQEWELKNRQQFGSWDTGHWNGFSIRMRLIDHN